MADFMDVKCPSLIYSTYKEGRVDNGSQLFISCFMAFESVWEVFICCSKLIILVEWEVPPISLIFLFNPYLTTFSVLITAL
jgi:hypothetical protein